MKPTKRNTLHALSVLPLLATPVARAQTDDPINVVGFGDCGERVMRLLDRQGLLRGDYATLHDHRHDSGLNLSEPLHPGGGDVHRGRPVAIIAGGGGRSYNNTLRSAREYARVWGGELSALVFLPFAWEGGERRTRALSLAAQLGFACPLVATIDNGTLADAVLVEDDISLLQCYDRVNAHALSKVAQFLAMVRTAV